MKQVIILTMLFSLKGYAQNADAIVGKWLKTNKQDLIIEVYKDKEEYKGKINWSKDNVKPVGFTMLDDLKYNQKEKKWDGGKIHDPESGRSYNATVKMKPDGTIEVSGSLLFFKSKRIFRRVRD